MKAAPEVYHRFEGEFVVLESRTLDRLLEAEKERDELARRIETAKSLCHETGRYNAARLKVWKIRVFACDILAALGGERRP